MNKHPLANCEQCPLRDTGTYVAPMISDGQYPIALVTGAPYQADIWSGGFKQSKAGQLVAKVMRHNSLSIDNAFHCNAIQCQPQEGQKINVATIAACRPVVQDIVNKHLAPEGSAILMGSEATTALAASGGVFTARVGPAKGSPWLTNGRRVIPTVNPYLCMKQQQHFPSLVTDFGKIKKKTVVFEEPMYFVIEDPQQAEHLLSAYTEASLHIPNQLVIDIECVIDKETAFGHPENYEMLCIGLKWSDEDIIVLTQEALNVQVYKALSELMHYCYIVAHNGKFDLNGIRPHIGRQLLSFDTMLASYVFDERTGNPGYHGLKYLAQEFLGAPAYDEELDKFIGSGQNKDFSKAPKEILYKYNAYDIYCTYLLAKMYQDMLDEADEELTKLNAHLIKASNFLMDLEYNGITVDEEYLEKLSEELDQELLLKEYLLSKAAYKINPNGYEKGNGINPNSPLQLKKFYNDCNIELSSTNEETLNKIISYPNQFPENDKMIRIFTKRVLAYRSEKKLKSTYVDGIRNRTHNGKVHSSYLLHGTTTGRLSSRNPNLQNIPRTSPVKRLFVASSPDRVIVNVDYSQAELRVISYLAQDEFFRDIFKDESRDVFDELVPRLFPGANKERDDPKAWKEKRTMVKTYVYGLSYGRTEFGIARGFGIPVDLAKKHMQRFFSTIPRVIKWQNDIKAQVMNGEDLITPYGRHRRYSLITDENQRDVLNEALAFLPQSTASDMCLTAAYRVNEMFHDADRNTYYNGTAPKIVNIVHDAIMFECEKDVAEGYAKLVGDKMIESAQEIVGDYVPFAVDSSWGYSWSDIK